MTRCSCPGKRSCRNPNTSFFYKILSCLKQLQSTQQFCNGATVEDIAKFMEAKYDLSGDIYSQIENSLSIAEESRFVIRKRNCYSLVSPAATLQLIPAPCVKAKLERIQKVFNSKWCEKEEKPDRCRPPRRRQSACERPCPCPGKRPSSCEPRPRCPKTRSMSRCTTPPTTRSKRRTRSRGKPPCKCTALPKPKCKAQSKPKRKARTKPKSKRKAAKTKPRSASASPYRTRSRTKRRAKVPVSTSLKDCKCSEDDSDSSSS